MQHVVFVDALFRALAKWNLGTSHCLPSPAPPVSDPATPGRQVLARCTACGGNPIPTIHVRVRTLRPMHWPNTSTVRLQLVGCGCCCCGFRRNNNAGNEDEEEDVRWASLLVVRGTTCTVVGPPPRCAETDPAIPSVAVAARATTTTQELTWQTIDQLLDWFTMETRQLVFLRGPIK